MLIGGNEFWLSVYRDFNDVELVFAPPSSIGKFGWDTDNWMWPRATAVISRFFVFMPIRRTNRPIIHPIMCLITRHVAPVSLGGYKEGSFCMTLGYPGSTVERFLSSLALIE